MWMEYWWLMKGIIGRLIGQTTLQGEIKGEKEMKLLYSVKAYCVCVCVVCVCGPMKLPG
jgi:hypothetical protein